MSERISPETEMLWSAYDKGECGTAYLKNKMADMETERDEVRELARKMRVHLMNLVDHEPCKCCYDDEAETDWVEAKSLLTKAKEVLL